MAVNLMDMVKTALAGSIGEQLGSAVGLDKRQASSAIEAAVPMLLGGMLKKASTPSGASELSNALRDQDPSLLDNLGGMLGGGSSSVSNMISMGSKFLPMLLGSGQGNLIAMLVKMLGINEKTILSLLGMLAPIVMSVVGKQAKASGGLDASSLTSLLGGQKNFIANAMPSELKGAMGLADNVSAAASRTAEVAKSSNPLQWLLPLIALAVLGYLGYTFLFNQQPEANKPADARSNTTTGTIPDMPNRPLDGLPELKGLQTSLTTTFQDLTGALEGITDEATATSARGQIESTVKAYTDLGVDKLPDAVKSGLTPFLKPLITNLSSLLDKLYLIPGVKDIIEPVVGPFVKAVTAIGE